MRIPVTAVAIALCVQGLAAATAGAEQAASQARALQNAAGLKPRPSSDALAVFPDPAAALVVDAIMADDGATVTKLIHDGANVNASGEGGRSLLEFALWQGKHAAFDALLAAGADTSHGDAEGETVMHYAASDEDPSYLNELLARHVDPNSVNKVTGKTLVMDAALVDQGSQLRALIAAGADLNRVTPSGDTALIMAARTNSFERVLELLQAGANPLAKNITGATFQGYLTMTPEDVLSDKGKQEIAQIHDWLTAHKIPIEPRGTLQGPAGVTAGTEQAPSQDSELLKQIAKQMVAADNKARAVQNAAGFTQALRAYDPKRPASCTNLEFESLDEPPESTFDEVSIYVMDATCEKDPERHYRAQITFSDGARTIAKSVKVLDRLDPATSLGDPEFERVMHAFVERALKGDVDGMVALTSKVTIAQTGLADLKAHYATDTMLGLQAFPTIAPGSRAAFARDENSAPCWVYQMVFVSPKGEDAKIQFIVVKEAGVIGVGSIDLWQ
ncbi:MAG: ankyrin repeat domain-containing protein [Vicinamibacterales bacterium]